MHINVDRFNTHNKNVYLRLHTPKNRQKKAAKSGNTTTKTPHECEVREHKINA